MLPALQSCVTAIAGETRLLSSRGATMVPRHPPRACSQRPGMEQLPEHPPLLPLPSCPHAWVGAAHRTECPESQSTETVISHEPGLDQRTQCSSCSQSRRDGQWLQGAQPRRSWPPAAPEHCVLLQMAIRTAAEVVQTSSLWVHASSHGPERITHT